MNQKSHSRAFTPFCHAGLVSASSRYNNKTLGPRTKTLRGGTNGIVPVQGDGERGFTLIELLVVVLIIGILAAVAVPQYQKAVAKSRATEGLVAIDSAKKQIDLYVLGNGLPNEVVNITNRDIDLPSESSVFCAPDDCNALFQDTDSNGNLQYVLQVCGYVVPDGVSSCLGYDYTLTGRWYQGCWTNDTTLGKLVCQYLESQGWKMMDSEW